MITKFKLLLPRREWQKKAQSKGKIKSVNKSMVNRIKVASPNRLVNIPTFQLTIAFTDRTSYQLNKLSTMVSNADLLTI